MFQSFYTLRHVREGLYGGAYLTAKSVLNAYFGQIRDNDGSIPWAIVLVEPKENGLRQETDCSVAEIASTAMLGVS